VFIRDASGIVLLLATSSHHMGILSLMMVVFYKKKPPNLNLLLTLPAASYLPLDAIMVIDVHISDVYLALYRTF
jgi:hypothetical protein